VDTNGVDVLDLETGTIERVPPPANKSPKHVVDKTGRSRVFSYTLSSSPSFEGEAARDTNFDPGAEYARFHAQPSLVVLDFHGRLDGDILCRVLILVFFAVHGCHAGRP
jgi:hypothetical protein